MSRRHLVLVLPLVLVLAAAVPVLAESPAGGEAPVVQTEPVGDAPLPIGDSPLLTPAPQEKAPPCHFCGGPFTSPTHWGHGPDCASAEADVRAQLLDYVNADCQEFGTAGRCGFSVVYTNCWYNGSGYTSDAYANYKCWVNYC